ncbi:MAG TPA: VWA domain-containing protein [Vicinamibacterales bacterium]|nr:VWA domain-containing protein [Acidobacteriota bacterium]HOC18868.1 VWA domain-containing protein [Vicinamibacterales bacterium]
MQAAQLRWIVAFIALASVAAIPGERPAGAQQAPAGTTAVEALVVDRDGRLVEGLGPSDFSVTVDGRTRPVLWVKRVSRGPGASADAASRQFGADSARLYAAEPRRSVFIVIDEATMVRGDERNVVRAADALLERLGIDDLIAVVRIPVPAETLLTLTTERPPIREALSTIVGRSAPATTPAETPGLAELSAMAEPSADPTIDRVPDLNKPPDGPVRAAAGEMEKDATEEDLASARTALTTLDGLMASLQRLPGRKVVLLFSAGLFAPSQVRVEETAATAALARATVYAYGLRGVAQGPRRAPDLGPIETIARATGGSFAMLGRNPRRAVERTIAELSASYVLGIEADPSDTDGGRHAVRVEVARKGATARFAAWLPAAEPPADETPAAQEFATEAPADAASEAASPAAEKWKTAPPSTGAPAALARAGSSPSPREAELKLALARLFEYADAYERQYSMLVTEEEYLQTHRSGRTLTRADLLLVRPANRWVSFRDVFEVDGRPVRDREDRLRRLFLDPTPEAQARLQSVMDESAKYNVGPVVRSINVPLFPLDILKSWNRERFDFKLGRDADVDGLRAWRIDYTERERPTLVEGLEGEDIPIKGRFLVDQLTGAIVETTVALSKETVNGEIVVRYGRDPALGLWVPTQMRETYLQGGRRILMEGRAGYSKFRRFQVKTEESVTLPVK